MNLNHPTLRLFAATLLVLTLSLLTACGGTKVYTADKTVVHKGSIYNLANVSKIGTRVEGKLADGETVNMANMDKKQVDALLKENDEIMVSTIFDLDDQEMLYQRVRVKSSRDYSKVMSNFEKAGTKMTKFMADKKKTQLEL